MVAFGDVLPHGPVLVAWASLVSLASSATAPSDDDDAPGVSSAAGAIP